MIFIHYVYVITGGKKLHHTGSESKSNAICIITGLGNALSLPAPSELENAQSAPSETEKAQLAPPEPEKAQLAPSEPEKAQPAPSEPEKAQPVVSPQSAGCDCKRCAITSPDAFKPRDAAVLCAFQNKGRKFLPSWFKDRKWITLCTKQRKVFCATCRYAKEHKLITYSISSGVGLCDHRVRKRQKSS